MFYVSVIFMHFHIKIIFSLNIHTKHFIYFSFEFIMSLTFHFHCFYHSILIFLSNLNILKFKKESKNSQIHIDFD